MSVEELLMALHICLSLHSYVFVFLLRLILTCLPAPLCIHIFNISATAFVLSTNGYVACFQGCNRGWNLLSSFGVKFEQIFVLLFV